MTAATLRFSGHRMKLRHSIHGIIGSVGGHFVGHFVVDATRRTAFSVLKQVKLASLVLKAMGSLVFSIG